MKKMLLLGILSLQAMLSIAQNPTYQQKLYYTCKIWGFVKYFHSGVSNCQVNWDSVLVARLQAIKNAVTSNDFNNELDTLLNDAGPMAIVPGVLPDTIAPALKRNRNFAWISDPMLRTDVQVILDTIKNNFRPHQGCWVQNNNYTNSYTGWLVFPQDSLMLDSSIFTHFPNEWERSLLAFKHWNIINYFNPYNYVLDKPWDSTLFNKILPIVSAPNAWKFYYAFKQMTSQEDDAHVEGLTWNANYQFPYFYAPELVLTHIPNNYVVVKSNLPGIRIGDAIVSINGLTPTNWEDSLRPYTSAGNLSVFRRFVSQYMISGPPFNSISIVYSDSLGVHHTVNSTYNTNIYSSWFTNYYPNDTLATVHWKKFGCGIGYVNMGQFQNSDVSAMYSTLRNSPAIIFDLRNYPNGTVYNLTNAMYQNQTCFSKLTIPDVTYPGTYTWYYDFYGYNGNPTPYYGKVILLMNEQTQSQAEFTCMALGAIPNSVKIGSQTAGADGNITYYRLSQDNHTGFTTLGVYYPNGDSTQRIGIVPDSVVYQTAIGIRHKRDEVLEKALQVANCATGISEEVNSESNFHIYPNPSKDEVMVALDKVGIGNLSISICDLSGRKVFENDAKINSDYFLHKIELAPFPPGMYFITIKTNSGSYSKKLIKE